MSKPLAGSRYFEALGRRASSLGYPITYRRHTRNDWAEWAQQSWARGWIQQGHVSNRKFAEIWSKP